MKKDSVGMIQYFRSTGLLKKQFCLKKTANGHGGKVNMKIFLIGKNGQVGEEIHKQSAEMGFEIIPFGSRDLDITDHEKVKQKIEKHKPDAVINTAAYHIVSDCERFIDKAFSINVFAVKNLASICNANNIRFINYSYDT